jgi:twitching motility two-component system response regulator PilG
MNNNESKTGSGPIAPPGMAASRVPADHFDDGLLGSSIFGAPLPAPAPRQPVAAAPAEPVPALRLAVKGLKPVERQLLEGLVKVSQRRTPRLEIMDDMHAREADVVMIDTRDPAAMAWAQQRTWLARRAVIWIDGSEAGRGHTLLRRPVQWPILPMVLARALESGPDTAAGTAKVALPQAPRAASAEVQRTHQVLVVDDSLAVRAHLRSLLEPCGYQVTDADSVEAALKCIAQRAFDCVLMDVLMPEIDGYEGCHRIKSKLRGADAVPVVMLTSRGSPFDRIRGKMAGCDAYLTKPVDPQVLGEVLAQQVGGVPPRPRPPPTAALAEPPVVVSRRFLPTRPSRPN